MKKFTLTFAVLCAFCAFAYAGTEQYSGKEKEVLQQAPPPCDWYHAHEWDISIWGTYARPADTGYNSKDFPHGDLFDGQGTDVVGQERDLGHFREDRFINKNHAWGGGGDIKYFPSKYWGVGMEGFALGCSSNIGGAYLGTVTFRYPIGCSRFAPYAFAGFGILGGGSHSIKAFEETRGVVLPRSLRRGGVLAAGTITEREVFEAENLQNKEYLAVGQFGAGIEVRILRPSERCKLGIGLMADFAWNVVQNTSNDFGMVRSGLTFSY